MKLPKTLGILCTIILSAELLVFAGIATKDTIDKYIDARIRVAVNSERIFVYGDLAKLYPSRIAYTRHGCLYVIERR